MIRRAGFFVTETDIAEGACAFCGRTIAGCQIVPAMIFETARLLAMEQRDAWMREAGFEPRASSRNNAAIERVLVAIEDVMASIDPRSGYDPAADWTVREPSVG